MKKHIKIVSDDTELDVAKTSVFMDGRRLEGILGCSVNLHAPNNVTSVTLTFIPETLKVEIGKVSEETTPFECCHCGSEFYRYLNGTKTCSKCEGRND